MALGGAKHFALVCAWRNQISVWSKISVRCKWKGFDSFIIRLGSIILTSGHYENYNSFDNDNLILLPFYVDDMIGPNKE